jgi:death-on-curing protein
MQTIVFIDIDEIIDIHALLIHETGGSHGLRDQALLESATVQPRMTFGGAYIHKTIFLMAATYLFHLIKNHPFVDGNKRTGIFIAINFLELNGYEVKATKAQLYRLTINTATSKISKPDIAAFLKRHSKKC